MGMQCPPRQPGFDDLPDVQAELVAHQQHLVGHGDVDGAEGVLVDLDHLGGLGGGDRDNRIERGGVECAPHRKALGRCAADDFGGVPGRPVGAPGIHALRREAEEEIPAQLQVPAVAC